MPSIKNRKSQPALAPAALAISPSDAEAAFMTLNPRLSAIGRGALIQVNADIQVTAVFALGVSRFANEPAVRERFARLGASGEFNDACVDDLAMVAQAAWFVRHRYLVTSATHSEARVPSELLAEATAQRARMLKLADYWLGDDPGLGAEISAIRAGAGYQDLANDLMALAALFHRNEKELAKDKKHYQPSDVAAANRLAGALVSQLGAAATPEERQWAAMQPRAWTLLVSTYEEVRRGGLFLFAKDGGEERFPSLLSVGRGPSSRPARESSPSAVDNEAERGAPRPNGAAASVNGSAAAPA